MKSILCLWIGLSLCAQSGKLGIPQAESEPGFILGVHSGWVQLSHSDFDIPDFPQVETGRASWQMDLAYQFRSMNQITLSWLQLGDWQGEKERQIGAGQAHATAIDLEWQIFALTYRESVKLTPHSEFFMAAGVYTLQESGEQTDRFTLRNGDREFVQEDQTDLGRTTSDLVVSLGFSRPFKHWLFQGSYTYYSDLLDKSGSPFTPIQQLNLGIGYRF
ncbi:MAG: hypothetical protein KDC71_21785 [Acidobacteria bacterium]|nr:hypothetical protein [Acidobacteriota bacterium]